MTRAVRSLIEDIIEETLSTNRYVLFERIRRAMEERHPGISLEYQLSRMGIETTKRDLEAIDEYFYKIYLPRVISIDKRKERAM